MAASPPPSPPTKITQTIPFESLFTESSASMDDIARRERRCRKLEREAAEAKDRVWTLQHTVHILENIKHVSRDYIRQLYQLLDATMDQNQGQETRGEQIGTLHQTISYLESSLKQWEAKYSAISAYSSAFAFSENNNNQNNSAQSSSELQAEDFEGEYDDEEDYDDDIEDDADVEQIGGGDGTMPFELCEVSMATADDVCDNNDNDDVDEDVDLESSTLSDNTAASEDVFNKFISKKRKRKHHQHHQTQLLNLNLNHQLNNLNSNTGNLNNLVLTCDHPGCSYRTGARRQLAMHKRSHDGEVLYTCDIPGCGYLSNYKGNIKVHKKHRHRIEESSTSANGRGRGQGRKIFKDTKIETVDLTAEEAEVGGVGGDLAAVVAESAIKYFHSNKNGPHQQHLSSYELNNNTSGNDSKDNGNQQNGTPGLHSCSVEGCSYRSKWKQCLVAHQLQHAGVKPYKCDHPGCHYSTNFKGNVNVHKRVHRGSVPAATMYQCRHSGCRFSTPWKNSILVHQGKHHQKQNQEKWSSAGNVSLLNTPAATGV